MSKRPEQVGQQIQEILSEAIQYELRDPRVGFATVTRVEVSNDLQHARVFVSVMGDDEQRRETLAGLEHARGFLRRQVAQELSHLRSVPNLTFALDTSLDYSLRIGEVLRQVEAERAEVERQRAAAEADEQAWRTTDGE